MEGFLADIPDTLIVEALTRAAIASDGMPLHASKSAPGLFPSSTLGKTAAQHCKDAGLLRVLRSETKGKNTSELCGITDRGLALLLQQADLRPALQTFVNALDERQASLERIHDDLRCSQHDLDALRATAVQVLERLTVEQQSRPARNARCPDVDVPAATRGELIRWHDSEQLGDCPLPELFRRLRQECPQLTIGQFHDHLRLLHQERAVYLHPWTGPLYELPEPALALLIGHEIAYYASLNQSEECVGTAVAVASTREGCP